MRVLLNTIPIPFEAQGSSAPKAQRESALPSGANIESAWRREVERAQLCDWFKGCRHRGETNTSGVRLQPEPIRNGVDRMTEVLGVRGAGLAPHEVLITRPCSPMRANDSCYGTPPKTVRVLATCVSKGSPVSVGTPQVPAHGGPWLSTQVIVRSGPDPFQAVRVGDRMTTRTAQSCGQDAAARALPNERQPRPSPAGPQVSGRPYDEGSSLVRVHVEFERAGAKVWLGVDAAAAHHVSEATVAIAKWLGSMGHRSLQWTCNGRPWDPFLGRAVTEDSRGSCSTVPAVGSHTSEGHPSAPAPHQGDST
jgi:hypothetical protein